MRTISSSINALEASCKEARLQTERKEVVLLLFYSKEGQECFSLGLVWSDFVLFGQT